MPRYEFRWSAFGTCEVDADDQDEASDLIADALFAIDDAIFHQVSTDGTDVHFEREVI